MAAGEVLVAPDAVASMIAWLKDQLPGIPGQAEVGVFRAVPSPRPAAFVRVRLGGGPGRTSTVVDGAQLNIEAWADSAASAHDLAVNARAVALAAQGAVLGGVQVYRVEDGGYPVDLPDDLPSQQQRFTFTVVAHMRASRPA